jgi:hypothetical protein
MEMYRSIVMIVLSVRFLTGFIPTVRRPADHDLYFFERAEVYRSTVATTLSVPPLEIPEASQGGVANDGVADFDSSFSMVG